MISFIRNLVNRFFKNLFRGKKHIKLGLYGPGGYIGGIPGVAVPMGFNTVMAHSLAHPRGYMKRFLFRETPGAFLEKFGKEATRTGIMWLPREEEKRIKSPEQ